MDFDKIISLLYENFDVDDSVVDIITTLEFRYNKNHYIFKNIKALCAENNVDENIECIYFELENLLINLRSTVDIVCHLINNVYKMNIKDDISISQVKNNRKCTPVLREIFGIYTNPKHKTWNFIYNTRNTVVHEVCIKNNLPIIVDSSFNEDKLVKKVYFIDGYGDKENLIFFYGECINLIDDFLDKTLFRISNNYR